MDIYTEVSVSTTGGICYQVYFEESPDVADVFSLKGKYVLLQRVFDEDNDGIYIEINGRYGGWPKINHCLMSTSRFKIIYQDGDQDCTVEFMLAPDACKFDLIKKYLKIIFKGYSCLVFEG